MDAPRDLRKRVVSVGLCALFLLSYVVDYDSRTGWRFVDYPFSWKINEVSKSQALALIGERRIKTYGVSDGRILMSSSDGKWLSLDYGANHDVVRRLGGQGVTYVGYYDYWR